MSPPGAALRLLISEAQNGCRLTSAWIWMHARCHAFVKEELMMSALLTRDHGCPRCHVSGLRRSRCGGRGSWLVFIHSVEIKEKKPPSDTVSDLISLWCSLHFQELFTLPVNPLCLHLPHLLSDFHCLPECLLTTLREWVQTCCFPPKVGVWAYKETESVIIHLWVTCVGGRSKRDGKTKAGCTAFWSIEATVGVSTGICALMISPCIIAECRSKIHTQLMLWLKNVLLCQKCLIASLRYLWE